MNKRISKLHLLAAVLSFVPCSITMAQSVTDISAADTSNSTVQSAATQGLNKDSSEHPLIKEKNWYFSWGYSRQQYAPSDIHVTQPGLGNNFTVHQAAAQDFPASPRETLDSIANLDFTTPQENIRIGRFMNPEKTFALEFSLDHSKYNTNLDQTAYVTGTTRTGNLGGQPINQNVVLNAQTFDYKLHNGLNHIMLNAVWLQHLYGPEQKQGDLQLISRLGAGILVPHADNKIDGNADVVGPKNQNVCCFSSNDWWQINGWTAGVEVGVRYRVLESMYLELTSKVAYGVLRHVAVYQGTADQTIWMAEEVLSAGYLF